ncbi:AT-rich interactive domain-containing protein 5B-like [Amphibalanus amphitrite]|uniref:AT-rich interactive domain-containing protein 5B-like n=1 Tax=Amphibalanus amphitrite TaxID=1232801 RepID=UPI001C9002DA|nr:AT-rich interactive domain-containing protein 5B-like [Amphibalanus amphitrite]
MSKDCVEVVGSPCGQHGSYVFHKAFSFVSGGRRHVLALGEFFFVKPWRDEEVVCICELQLLYQDSSDGDLLACVRLYLLPEHTPEGRLESHGEDEVLAIQDKLTLRLEDLAAVVMAGDGWAAGREVGTAHDPSAPPAVFRSTCTNVRLDLDDVARVKRELDDTVDVNESCALVLSYDHYCRVRAMLKRLESISSRVYAHNVIKALGGFHIPSRNTRLLFCRQLVEVPDLDGHELFCNHLAPKLRGRTRKKPRQRSSSSPSSESTSDTEAGRTETESTPAVARRGTGGLLHKPAVPGLTPAAASRPFHQLRSARWDQRTLLQRMQTFMTQRGTPLTVPAALEFKEENIFRLYRRVQEMGGYHAVCGRRQWRHLFSELGLDAGKTTAGASLRRCYEKLCLPYERHERGLPESATAPPPPLTSHHKTTPTSSVGQSRAAPAASSAAAAVLSSVAAAVGRGHKRASPDAAEVALLAQARPAITITPVLPRPAADPAALAGYTALQRLSSMARQTEAKRPRLEPPPPAHQGAPRRPPAGRPPASSAGPVEVIDLTTGGVRPPAPQPPLSEPSRIGSITITPVQKVGAAPAPAAAAGAGGSVEHLLALHMASAALPPPMLQYMGLMQAGGKERLQRLQQQLTLQSLMAQRLVLMPGGLHGLSPEQAASLEAYQRAMMQAGLRRS